MKKQLEEISLKMQILAHSRDYEMAHIEADELLINLVELLNEGLQENQELAEYIIEQYDNVGKWYA